MDLIKYLLNEPLILLFVIMLLGSWLGNWKIKGISLGSAGVLLVALVFGHFGYQVSPIIQNFGLSLFIVAIGFQAGPSFFRIMRTDGLRFAFIALFITLVAIGSTFIVAKLFNLPTALSVGLLTGALTSTPGLAAALQATNDPLASVGYGIAYPFGTIAVILFVQLLPRILKVDLQKDLEEATGPVRNELSPEIVTIVITNPKLHKRTISELNFTKHSIIVSRVIRGQQMLVALGDTVLLLGDKLVTVGNNEDIGKIETIVGSRVDTRLENTDNIQFRKIVVESPDILKKSLKDLNLRKQYGATVTRIVRKGVELNPNPNIPLLQGDILTVVSTENRLDEVEMLFSKKKIAVTNIHIFSLSLTLLIGILFGMLPIYIPGLGEITLGIAGGPLFIALILGHLGKVGPIRVRYYGTSNAVIQELGLSLFLAGAGTTAGQGLLDIIQTQGLKLLFGGMIITISSILAGYFIAKKLLKLSVAHALGALSGGLTSTPGLGALRQMIDAEEPAAAYAATYPFALILMALSAQLIVLIL